MKTLRNGLLALALGLLACAVSAQTAPRALRILVPFSAGGASDTYTRIAALKITEQRSESTRLNSSHLVISYAVFCLKKKKKHNTVTAELMRTDVRARY